MSKTLACWFGRHDWASQMQRLDDVEAARPVDICRRCGRLRSGFGQSDFGRGGGGGMGGGGMGGGDGADAGGGGGGGGD